MLVGSSAESLSAKYTANTVKNDQNIVVYITKNPNLAIRYSHNFQIVKNLIRKLTNDPGKSPDIDRIY